MERSPEGERSLVVGQIRRRLSVAAVKAQCSSLLGRLEVIGPGMKEAAGRRARALDVAFSMERDRAAFMQTIRTPVSHIRIRNGAISCDVNPQSPQSTSERSFSIGFMNYLVLCTRGKLLIFRQVFQQF